MELNKGISSFTSVSVLAKSLEILPADTDFNQIVEILPANDPHTDTHGAFFKTWSKYQPEKGADCIMSDMKKYSPELIERPVDAILKQDLNAGIEWIQRLLDGPHFDAAASYTVDILRGRELYDLASQLANQIGDPSKRRAISKIASEPFPSDGPNQCPGEILVAEMSCS